jgi:hypothetical protein
MRGVWMSDKNTSVINAYRARKEIDEAGIWVKMLSGKIKIKSALRNIEFARKIKPFADNPESLENEDVFDGLVDILADTIVLDWEGFGVEYSKDSFIETCSDLKECGFVEDILEHVMDKELFNQVAIAKTAKN